MAQWQSAYHWEIVSSNPADARATRGQELKRTKLACGLRVGGVIYSHSPLACSDTSRSWVSVSSCEREQIALFSDVAPCVRSCLKRCSWLASCDSLHCPRLVAVVDKGENVV